MIRNNDRVMIGINDRVMIRNNDRVMIMMVMIWRSSDDNQSTGAYQVSAREHARDAEAPVRPACRIAAHHCYEYVCYC